MWRVIFGLLALVGLGFIGFRNPGWWPGMLALGLLLILAALAGRMGRPLKNFGAVMTPHMELPESWDEGEITRGLELYRGDSGVLGTYIDGIVSRFVMGQNMRTMEVRAQFLEKFNKYGEIARTSYKWQRYLNGDRAKIEEDSADARAELELAKAKKDLAALAGDPELIALQKKVDRLTLELQAATTQKAIDDLNRPDPLPPPAPPSPREERDRLLAELAEREREVLKAIRETEEDDSLEPDLKQRKLNGLYAKLAEIHEEQNKLR